MAIRSGSVNVRLRVPVVTSNVNIPVRGLQVIRGRTKKAFNCGFSPAGRTLVNTTIGVLRHPISLMFGRFRGVACAKGESPTFVGVGLTTSRGNGLLTL